MKKAMQYTGDNAMQLIENFGLDACQANFNLGKRTLVLPCKLEALMPGEWVVAPDGYNPGQHGAGYLRVLPASIMQSIIESEEIK